MPIQHPVVSQAPQQQVETAYILCRTAHNLHQLPHHKLALLAQGLVFFEIGHAIGDEEYYSMLWELGHEQVEYFANVCDAVEIRCLDSAVDMQAETWVREEHLAD